MLKQRMMRCGWVLAILALSGLLFGQAVTGSGGQYGLGRVLGTGQVGSSIVFTPLNGQTTPPPANYTVDWSNAGTAPGACTFEVEGSSDRVHWYGLTSAIDCTAPNMRHIVNKPVAAVRVNVLTYTAGDGTTAVTFNYTRGQ